MSLVLTDCGQCGGEAWIPEKDYQAAFEEAEERGIDIREFYCSQKCFRRRRDHLRGAVHDEHHQKVCDLDHGDREGRGRRRPMRRGSAKRRGRKGTRMGRPLAV